MQIFLGLDGPVLNVSQRYYAIYSDLLKQGHFTPLDQASYWSLKRLGFEEAAIVSHACSREFTEEYLVERRNLLEDPAYLVMDELHPKALRQMQIWSSAHTLNIIAMRHNYQSVVSQLDYLGLGGCVENILVGRIGTPEWQTKKERIEENLGDSNNALVIGDREGDLLAAHALELPSVAVTCGFRTRRLLKHLFPDLLVKNIASLDIENWPSLFSGNELRLHLHQNPISI